jgi:hypothetical protein
MNTSTLRALVFANFAASRRWGSRWLAAGNLGSCVDLGLIAGFSDFAS